MDKILLQPRKSVLAIKLCGLMLTATVMCSVASASAPHAAAMSALNLAKYHYREGNFIKAAAFFREAYNIDPNPLFMFNSGRSWQRAFKLKKAKATFEEFLGLETKGNFVGAQHVAAIRRAKMHLAEIKVTRAHVAQARAGATGVAKPKQQTATAPAGSRAGKAPVAAKSAATTTAAAGKAPAVTPSRAAPPVSVTLPSAKPSSAAWRAPAAWVLGGLGVALLGYGSWQVIDISRRSDALDKKALATKDADGKFTALDVKTYANRREELVSSQSTALVTLGVGVVATGIGGYLLWRDHSAGALTLAPQLNGRGLVLTGHF